MDIGYTMCVVLAHPLEGWGKAIHEVQFLAQNLQNVNKMGTYSQK